MIIINTTNHRNSPSLKKPSPGKPIEIYRDTVFEILYGVFDNSFVFFVTIMKSRFVTKFPDCVNNGLDNKVSNTIVFPIFRCPAKEKNVKYISVKVMPRRVESTGE